MNSQLKKYRVYQKRLALHRDNYYCVMCYFEAGKYVKADDVHHVFGRGVEPSDPNEHYTNLMSICRTHHDSIDAAKAPDSFQEVVRLLEKANDTPINRFFKHKP